MSDTAPLVFVSHASEDKDRFVLPFAESLRNNGVNAWVDRWEINVGDSLVEKIFEEGLKEAQAVIVVLSQFSVQKTWVRKELDAGVVNKINRNCKLLPIVLDGLTIEQLPQSIHSLKWVSVKDTANYDQELAEILQAIFEHYEKPPIGRPPKYASPDLHLIPGLNRVDSMVLKLIGDLCMQGKRPDQHIMPDTLKAAAEALGLRETQLVESVEIFAEHGYFKDPSFRGTRIPIVRLSVYGFEKYASECVPNYEAIIRQVGALIENDQFDDITRVAERQGCSEVMIRHSLDWLKEKGLIRVKYWTNDGFSITHVSPQLKRWLNGRPE